MLLEKVFTKQDHLSDLTTKPASAGFCFRRNYLVLFRIVADLGCICAFSAELVLASSSAFAFEGARIDYVAYFEIIKIFE
jgi:hypothetical protein